MEGHQVSQSAANRLIEGFQQTAFQKAFINWIIDNHHPLYELETPAFREMIRLASPLAEEALWKNHQSVRDHIMAEYSEYIELVKDKLSKSTSKIHISFDGWTTPNNKHVLVGVCVHHLNEEGRLEDYLIAVPELIGKHSGENYAEVVGTILKSFGITSERLGCIVTDNAFNNDTAIDDLGQRFNFTPKHRRMRCSCHILNLGAQCILFGRDKDSFENSDDNYKEEEAHLAEWRKYGAIAVLIDLINSINTPQSNQLLAKLHREALLRMRKDYTPKDLIRPVKTRWNSYFSTFARAIEMKEGLDEYASAKLEEHAITTARAEAAKGRKKRKKDAERKKDEQPRLFIREGGLNSGDWQTIIEYSQLLSPFNEATKLLEGRGKQGRHGAIWEVLPTFEWILNELEKKKEQYEDIDFSTDQSSQFEDHVPINCNLGWQKIHDYYKKLDDSPYYYAACILHPHYKNLLNTMWAKYKKEDWLLKGNTQFRALWQEYKDKDLPAQPPPEKLTKKPKTLSSRSEFLSQFTSSSARYTEQGDDEYERWKVLDPLPSDHLLAKDPLLYWWLQRSEFPRLAQMALDVLSIPASSCDCERAFSELGDLLEPRRRRMHMDIIAAIQCTRSYKRLGLRPTRACSKLI